MADPRPAELADLLAPLARLVLNVQLVVLLLLSLQATRTATSLLLVGAMALTAVAPILAWSRLGPWFVAKVWPMLPLLLLAVGAGATQVVAPTLSIGYGVSVAVLAGLLHGMAGGIALASVIALAFLPGASQQPVPELLAAVAAVLAAPVGGARLRQLVIDLDASRRRVAARTTQLATAEERARVARALHDSLAKTIEGVHMTLSGLGQHVDGRGVQLLDQVTTGVERARVEAREVLDGLRDDRVDVPLGVRLHGLVTTFAEVAGMEGTVEVDDALPDLPADGRHEVLQVVREALRNVAAHSGAGHVTVRADGGDAGLAVEVLDDGSGQVHERPGHYGLQGMRERAELLGGSLQVGPRPEGGARVSLQVPITAEEAP